jgi:hydroxymethylbilane synthase
MQQTIVIGTRGSKLALWQAYFTKDKLEAAGFKVEIKIIKTRGDEIQHLSFDKIEGKGFFTKEIEDALLNKEIDLAVHSSKDLSTNSPEGLAIGAFSYRAAPNDTLLIRKEKQDTTQFLEMTAHAVVGTSSSRRKAQLLSFRRDIELKDIRGNVPTRIQKLRDGHYDAILLAAAGLDRLELDIADLVRIDLSPTMYIPAPAQGILAYQVRSDEKWLEKSLEVLNDKEVSTIAHLERSILNAFNGGCQMPLGVYAQKSSLNEFDLWVSKAESWDAIPQRMHFTVNEKVDTTQILNAFAIPNKADVFISRELKSNDFLKENLEALGHKLSGTSFIEFKAEPFTLEEMQCDWVFFSSKNAVKYFFEQINSLSPNIKIAAVNKGTAFAIQQLGYSPAFIGEGGDLLIIAQDFDATAGAKVLFAKAKHSRRSIQKSLQQKEIHEVTVYDNFIKTEIQKREESILVFTSPMNVEAYFNAFSLEKHQRLVAIGSPTEEALKAYGYTCKKSYEPTMWAVLDCVLAVNAVELH